MRLEPVRLPDALDGTAPKTTSLRHRAHAPARRRRRLGVKRHVHDSIDRRRRKRLAAGRTRRILQKPFDAPVAVAPPPSANGKDAHADFASHVERARPPRPSATRPARAKPPSAPRCGPAPNSAVAPACQPRSPIDQGSLEHARGSAIGKLSSAAASPAQRPKSLL